VTKPSMSVIQHGARPSDNRGFVVLSRWGSLTHEIRHF